jgi:subtilisin family serine protease
VVAVAAIDDQRHFATFSNHGPEVDFVAPGVNVLSTVPVGSRLVPFMYDGHEPQVIRFVNGTATGTVNGEYVFCGFGGKSDFPASVKGKIALVGRGGGITFSEKTINAMLNGASAVAIFNNDNSINPWSLQSDDPVQWPLVVRMPKEVGEALAAKGSGPLLISYDNYDYEENTGTSMSAPHVAGAAALLWTLAPNATAENIVTALRITAIDLGDPGPDNRFVVGMINIYAAARQLAASAFPPAPSTGRAPGRRGR